MVLAIEPMITPASRKCVSCRWLTAVTVDGSYSAHFEHTVAITKRRPQVLTQELRSNLGYDKTVLCARVCWVPATTVSPEQGSAKPRTSKESVCRRKMQ